MFNDDQSRFSCTFSFTRRGRRVSINARLVNTFLDIQRETEVPFQVFSTWLSEAAIVREPHVAARKFIEMETPILDFSELLPVVLPLVMELCPEHLDGFLGLFPRPLPQEFEVTWHYDAPWECERNLQDNEADVIDAEPDTEDEEDATYGDAVASDDLTEGAPSAPDESGDEECEPWRDCQVPTSDLVLPARGILPTLQPARLHFFNWPTDSTISGSEVLEVAGMRMFLGFGIERSNCKEILEQLRLARVFRKHVSVENWEREIIWALEPVAKDSRDFQLTVFAGLGYIQDITSAEVDLGKHARELSGVGHYNTRDYLKYRLLVEADALDKFMNNLEEIAYAMDSPDDDFRRPRIQLGSQRL